MFEGEFGNNINEIISGDNDIILFPSNSLIVLKKNRTPDGLMTDSG